jgi:hypothetical protein
MTGGWAGAGDVVAGGGGGGGGIADGDAGAICLDDECSGAGADELGLE